MYRILVLQICSNECWIRARWINDKNNNFYKTKSKETIYMLFLTISNLKSTKHMNQDEYCYHVKQIILASANSYFNFHILVVYYVPYFPLRDSTLYFSCRPFFFFDCTWKQVLSIQAIHPCFVKGWPLVS